MITGISGLLGSNLAFYLAKRKEKNKIVGTFNQNPFNVSYAKSYPVNLEEISQFERIFIKEKPEIFIHTAALTNVDKCEKVPKLTFNINSNVPKEFAKIAHNNNTKFVFISSDMVYGSDSVPHKEVEPTNPLNIYAKSKALAEKVILENNPNSLIIRTNFFGWNYQNKQSFAEWIINSIEKKKQITLFDDVYFTPLYVNYLSNTLYKAIKADLKGIFNFGSSNSISKYNFGVLLCKLFHKNSHYIKPISIDEKPFLVNRPKHMELAVAKIEKYLNIKLLPVENQINLMYNDYRSNYHEKLREE